MGQIIIAGVGLLNLICIHLFKFVTLGWALQCERFLRAFLSELRWFCVFWVVKVTKYSCWSCIIASSSYWKLISSFFVFYDDTFYFGLVFLVVGHMCPYSIWPWAIFVRTVLLTLDQWFPTGVPRHPGVPFAIPRGAAS